MMNFVCVHKLCCATDGGRSEVKVMRVPLGYNFVVNNFAKLCSISSVRPIHSYEEGLLKNNGLKRTQVAPLQLSKN